MAVWWVAVIQSFAQGGALGSELDTVLCVHDAYLYSVVKVVVWRPAYLL